MLTDYEIRKLAEYVVYQATFENNKFNEADIAEITEGVFRALLHLEPGLRGLGYGLKKNISPKTKKCS